jgi:hypothetical protein
MAAPSGKAAKLRTSVTVSEYVYNRNDWLILFKASEGLHSGDKRQSGGG